MERTFLRLRKTPEGWEAPLFDESKSPGYIGEQQEQQGGTVGDEAHDLNALAATIGLTFEEAVAKLLTPAPETSSRSAKAQPRPKLNALAVSLGLTYVEAATRLLTRPPETSSRSATAQPRVDDAATARAVAGLEHLEKQFATAARLPEAERARIGRQFVAAFERAQRRGVDVDVEMVREARRFLTGYNRRQRATKLAAASPP